VGKEERTASLKQGKKREFPKERGIFRLKGKSSGKHRQKKKSGPLSHKKGFPREKGSPTGKEKKKIPNKIAKGGEPWP